EELFDKITELTYPEIREFFARHVEGSEPLPLEENFRKVGISYKPMGTETVISYGNFVPGLDRESNRITVAGAADMDAFGQQVGFQEGDVLLAMNGTEITPMNVRELIGEKLQQMKPGERITFTVERSDEKGRTKKKKLKARVTPVERQTMHVLEPAPNATPEQQEMRAAWLNEEVQSIE
ncbi:MAG: peptidase M61, partial [Hymenobacteraceae bacterium]|nr:peptidase M61 [Hymenobacteraceae bacterium]